jgi:chemotaxis protein methyltransferase CheR/type IV pilus assembly protein PilK
MTKVDERRYRVNDELKKRVCFMRLNVLEMEDIPVGKMDLIFCQNLLIYFERDKRLRILDRLASHLVPGGYLILGSGEIIGWHQPCVEKIPFENTLVYRRLDSECAQTGSGDNTA